MSSGFVYCQTMQEKQTLTIMSHQYLDLPKVDGVEIPVPTNINSVNRLFNLSLSDEKEMNRWLDEERAAARASSSTTSGWFGGGAPANSEEMVPVGSLHAMFYIHRMYKCFHVHVRMYA